MATYKRALPTRGASKAAHPWLNTYVASSVTRGLSLLLIIFIYLFYFFFCSIVLMYCVLICNSITISVGTLGILRCGHVGTRIEAPSGKGPRSGLAQSQVGQLENFFCLFGSLYFIHQHPPPTPLPCPSFFFFKVFFVVIVSS
jgi:hypothetical protein